MDTPTNESDVQGLRTVSHTPSTPPDNPRKRKHSEPSAANAFEDSSTPGNAPRSHQFTYREVAASPTIASSSWYATRHTYTAPPSTISAIDATKHLVQTRDPDGNPITMFEYEGRRFPINPQFLAPRRPYTRLSRLSTDPLATNQARVIRPPAVPVPRPAGPPVIQWRLNEPSVAPVPNPYTVFRQDESIRLNLLPSNHVVHGTSPSQPRTDTPPPLTTRDIGVQTISTHEAGVQTVSTPLPATRAVGVDAPSACTTHDVSVDLSRSASSSVPRSRPTPPPVDVAPSPHSDMPTLRKTERTVPVRRGKRMRKKT